MHKLSQSAKNEVKKSYIYHKQAAATLFYDKKNPK